MKKDKVTLNDEIGRENYWQTVWRRFRHHRLACFSLAVLAVICTAAVLAPIIAPYDPEEIAGPVVFLCSEQASYRTGTSLEVSGGRSIVLNPEYSYLKKQGESA